MATEKEAKYALENKDYLALWQYFSEDTAKIKDKRWAIASWGYALRGGLMRFIGILIYRLFK